VLNWKFLIDKIIIIAIIMKELIKRNTNGWRISVLFVLTTSVYAIMLTVTIPYLLKCSGGRQILDMIPTGYSSVYVNYLFAFLGEIGRKAYLYNQLPMDMIYPLLFGVTYCLVLAYFVKKLGKIEGNLFYVSYLPLFAAFFDYCENIGIIAMLRTYPNNPDIMAEITSVFSILKSVLSSASFISLIIIVVIWSLRAAFGKNKISGNFAK
jgi:hypothetical protein